MACLTVSDCKIFNVEVLLTSKNQTTLLLCIIRINKLFIIIDFGFKMYIRYYGELFKQYSVWSSLMAVILHSLNLVAYGVLSPKLCHM